MMLAQAHFNQNKLNKVPSKKAVQMLLEQKGIDFNETVEGDNRVGNVLVYQKVEETKDIVVKGEQKKITFERKKCKMLNLGPKEVENIDESSLI